MELLKRIIEDVIDLAVLAFPVAFAWWLWRGYIKEINKDVNNDKRNKKSL